MCVCVCKTPGTIIEGAVASAAALIAVVEGKKKSPGIIEGLIADVEIESVVIISCFRPSTTKVALVLLLLLWDDLVLREVRRFRGALFRV